MTNSMIPYSFIPGTKAKANEVNANFVALANQIELSKEFTTENIESLTEILATKAGKSELVTEHTVTDTDTDLNNYKTKGTYIFSATVTPSNIPSGDSGMLIVTGDTNSIVKQIWFSSGETPKIYTRNFQNSEWGDWQNLISDNTLESTGYLKFPSGLIMQWGKFAPANVTYPIAFTNFACILFSKHGYGSGYARSDTGLTVQELTGFTVGTSGVFYHLNWIAIGY